MMLWLGLQANDDLEKKRKQIKIKNLRSTTVRLIGIKKLSAC